MKIQRFLFVLAFLLAIAEYSIGEDLASGCSKVTQPKPVVEATDLTSAQLPTDGQIEQGQPEQKFNDSCFRQSDCINLSFSNENIPDTTNFNVIEYYIKNVKHLLKKVDSKSIDMIEIL